MPENFKQVWAKEIICNIDNKNNYKSTKVEKLFVPTV